jgi:hypothetical protein
MPNRLRSRPPFKHREIDALGRADKVIEKVAALHESAHGTSRQFAATQHFGRAKWTLTEPRLQKADL